MRSNELLRWASKPDPLAYCSILRRLPEPVRCKRVVRVRITGGCGAGSKNWRQAHRYCDPVHRRVSIPCGLRLARRHGLEQACAGTNSIVTNVRTLRPAQIPAVAESQRASSGPSETILLSTEARESAISLRQPVRRIHRITRLWVSGTARDSASASDTRQSLLATRLRQNLAGGPLSPCASGAH